MPLSFISQITRIIRVSGLRLINGKKGFMLFLLAFLPVILIVSGKLLGGSLYGGTKFYIEKVTFFYHFIDLIVFIFLGCYTLGESIDDKTISYDLNCPLSRLALYIGKTLSYLISTMALLLPAHLTAYIICMGFVSSEMVFRNLQVLVAVMIVTALACLLYGVLFILLSLTFKRSVLFSIIYAVAIDIFLATIPIKANVLSIYVHFRNLSAFISNNSNFLITPSQFKIEIEYSYSIMVCLSLLILFSVGGCMIFMRKQLV